ncbi:cytochrome P450 [Lophiotrema nucula]|uniref:Cytochrome P450 n=1 Tax=Lophiotrema nucula TaxID=690887 RepID=A0A6A5ZDD9_9PLEO|nr:cytochrome P450 [Lophiotrema nucula]
MMLVQSIPVSRDVILGVLLRLLAPTVFLSSVVLALLLVSTLCKIPKQGRLRAWAYLFNGPEIIREAYLKSHGEPFEIHAPDARMVFVSSPKHIKEIDGTSDKVLSLNGAAKHMLQPLYTMNGFNWFDQRGVEGVGFVRTLRTLLTYNLPQLLPDLRVLTKARWSQMLTNSPIYAGKIHAPVYPMMMKMVVLLNARSLFGEDLIKDEKFMHSALSYVEETLFNAEIVKLLPKGLAPLVGRLLSRCLGAHKTFFKSLIPATEQRIQEQNLRNLGHPGPKRVSVHEIILNPWSAERVIYELMAIWFGSVHILSTTIVYVIHDLCFHPEYVELLRQELEISYENFERTGQGLPLLDSFIKESARLTPVESSKSKAPSVSRILTNVPFQMSVRRCALQPCTLYNGTQLGVGDWTWVPLAALNTSDQYYPSPHEFSGFRFVDPAQLPDGQQKPSQERPSKLTDVDHSFLMWGTGRMACPGRYYASVFIKAVVA